jgi:murE/murF fusion protein
VLLGELLRSSGILAEVGARVDLQAEVRAITADSRKVQPGTVFVAVSGARHRGLDFVPAALEAGAIAVVLDEPLHDPQVPVLKVEDARAAVGPLAAALHDHPSRRLHVVGITGTNGKTTTSVLVAQLCHAAGLRAAAIGTLGIWTPEGTRQGSMTTPDPADLQAILANLRDEGVTHVAMEVSSHALDQHRVAGVQFAVTLWTNLSRDHLDYHGTEEAYAQAKSRLFRDFQARHAFVNADDVLVRKVWEEGRAQAWSLGATPAAEHQLTGLHIDASGLTAVLQSRDLPDLPLQCPLLGRHNAENLVAAVLACRALGIDDSVLIDAVSHLQAPRGRLEPVANDLGALVLVDYAHTPDALEQVLAALRPLVATNARLITVFGCGGDRDRGKRPVMGRIAAQGADLSLVTSDNPRSEQPEAILADIEAGCIAVGADKLLKLVPSTLADRQGRAAYLLEPDRDQAIRRAIFVLQRGDVLLIAGKGHETTQTLGTQVRPFDDAAVARRWLQQHRATHATAVVEKSSGFTFDGPSARTACGGHLLVAGTRWTHALCTDSRQLGEGALFVALRGDRFDGGAFVLEAIRQGAAGVVCETGSGRPHLQEAQERGTFVLEVPDALVALGALSLLYRQRFSPLVVGVTGSNGKTTTKELTALALSPLGNVLATQGNFNNRIGVPLTLARLDASHRAAVVEMGMSEPGEITLLAAMALPTIGVVTNIGEAHLQGLGTLAAIASEKADLLRALPPDGVAILPVGEPLLEAIVATLACKIVRFGHQGDVRLTGVVTTEGMTQRFTADVHGTQVQVTLPGLGVHLAHNALAALAVAHAAGVDLHAAAQALGRYQPVGQRMLPSHIGPWLVLEDCYNANPRSTETALDTLATLPRPHVAVLGSMLELGESSAELHARVGRHAAVTGVDLLVGLGDHSPAYLTGAQEAGLPRHRTLLAQDAQGAAVTVQQRYPAGGTVLVKGSRGARMERVVAELRSLLTPDTSTSATGRA